MCYMQVSIINQCSRFYFTQNMFIPAFISVIMNWYKILRNDTIEIYILFSNSTLLILYLFHCNSTLRKERLVNQKFPL